ncbi:MAG: glycosyltransferase family 2 protein [Nanoarchaeota archaeon]|nr:glycosyltransferase family 2 protein [Nanoarchaeota archaeon]MBU1005582.1 glycosyltransferase family 2 protein [Nanoarchaeota archaeon]MBU1945968.1 glycosyltransferase family 2 protein [Nanoarchaeota archaeon]
MKVVITIPAYNEEKTIGRVIRDIKKVMHEISAECKILVIDDGSKDKTSEIAKKEGVIVFSHPINYGLAETFRTEMKKAAELDPDIIVHTDADGQYLASEIPKLIAPIKNKRADLVLGSRFKGRIESMPLIKKIGNRAFSKVISNITRTKISDGQTGFRAFTKEVAAIEIKSNHTYTQEQVIKAVLNKFRIVEVPVYFAERKGKSRLIKNPLEYAVKAWMNILRVYRDYEPLKFFGKIGGSFLTAGMLIGLYFIYLHLTTGISGHLGLLFLMLLLIFSGIQIILFGLLADMNKK